MQKVRLHLNYDGSEFYGWQRQKSTDQTVQGQLEAALSQIFDQKISCTGAGRTDTGVHALGQVAHFVSPKPLERYQLVKAINSLTPGALSCRAAWIAPDDFHALASAIGKTYIYLIHSSATPSALRRKYTTWERRPLDLSLLNEYSKILIGKQDFKSFQSRGTEVRSTHRRINQATWLQRDAQTVEFRIQGEGFLKQMVRNIVGSMLDLHWKAENPQALKMILEARDRRKALTTAPPEGLYLAHVQYPSSLDKRCRKL